ncbi:MAG: UrcA family protein [Gammaproteobacteria bacterium]|nr:UrcA family protein [Gammaproteobacteria bacterium]
MKMTLVGMSAAALACGSVLAQGLPEVKVEATRVVTGAISAKTMGKTASGVPVKDVTLSYGVSSEGLDLSTHTGALAFEQRVKDAADQACKEISRQYPDATPGEAECAKRAANGAMAQLHAAVAAAEKIRTATK